jgi:hypothetical protein
MQMLWLKFFVTSLFLAMFIIGEWLIALLVVVAMLPKVLFDQLLAHYRETFFGNPF